MALLHLVALVAGLVPGTLLAKGRAAISMAWAEPDFSSAAVRSVQPSSAEGLMEVVVDVPDDVVTGYSTPGQFVQLRPNADTKAGFFAIASAPRGAGSCLEFLIKSTESTEWICSAAPGAQAEVCAPMGKGFNIDGVIADNPDTAFDSIVLCAAGSGIAPFRAVIEADGPDGSPLYGFGEKRKGEVIYGARTTKDVAYRDRWDAWKSRGVDVTLALSKDPDAQAPTYAQQTLLDGNIVSSPETTIILACGMKDMVDGVREAAKELGVSAERVLTNF